jgi:5-methyltetrahydrofolate--homocysteine methyltransferase
MERALSYGIRKEDIYIDCLTLTASAEQEGVMETLKALKRVKEELGLKTVLGVSNISFGLPDRELINHNFLTMALTYGLDLPIINPNVASMTGAVRAYKLLTAIDKDSMEYIAAYNAAKEKAEAKNAGAAPSADAVSTSKGSAGMTLFEAVEAGLKNEGARITQELLKTTDSMVIINEMLIPALDKTGELFEKGKIFLPQLILSSQVAQAAFEVIKKNMVKSESKTESKNTIVVATVKGDIHDIGKNIVKVLLENYGYNVIDLGKDVEYQAVVDAVKKYDAKLVGLSALMTTTLVSMQKTIELIHENKLGCRIMVGGAVLTPDYAQSIGADFYVRDAKESIDVAKKVIG